MGAVRSGSSAKSAIQRSGSRTRIGSKLRSLIREARHENDRPDYELAHHDNGKDLQHASTSYCRKRSSHSRINPTRVRDGSRDLSVVLDGFFNDACVFVVESVTDIVADEIWCNVARLIGHI